MNGEVIPKRREKISLVRRHLVFSPHRRRVKIFQFVLELLKEEIEVVFGCVLEREEGAKKLVVILMERFGCFGGVITTVGCSSAPVSQ